MWCKVVFILLSTSCFSEANKVKQDKSWLNMLQLVQWIPEVEKMSPILPKIKEAASEIKEGSEITGKKLDALKLVTKHESFFKTLVSHILQDKKMISADGPELQDTDLLIATHCEHLTALLAEEAENLPHIPSFNPDWGDMIGGQLRYLNRQFLHQVSELTVKKNMKAEKALLMYDIVETNINDWRSFLSKDNSNSLQALCTSEIKTICLEVDQRMDLLYQRLQEYVLKPSKLPKYGDKNAPEIMGSYELLVEPSLRAYGVLKKVQDMKKKVEAAESSTQMKELLIQLKNDEKLISDTTERQKPYKNKISFALAKYYQKFNENNSNGDNRFSNSFDYYKLVWNCYGSCMQKIAQG